MPAASGRRHLSLQGLADSLKIQTPAPWPRLHPPCYANARGKNCHCPGRRRVQGPQAHPDDGTSKTAPAMTPRRDKAGTTWHTTPASAGRRSIWPCACGCLSWARPFTRENGCTQHDGIKTAQYRFTHCWDDIPSPLHSQQESRPVEQSTFFSFPVARSVPPAALAEAARIIHASLPPHTLTKHFS